MPDGERVGHRYRFGRGPAHLRVIDPSREELVAAQDPQGAGGQGQVGTVEFELPLGVFATGGVVAATPRQHPGDVLIPLDGGDEEAFEFHIGSILDFWPFVIVGS